VRLHAGVFVIRRLLLPANAACHSTSPQVTIVKNGLQVPDTQASFGAPAVEPDRRYNTLTFPMSKDTILRRMGLNNGEDNIGSFVRCSYDNRAKLVCLLSRGCYALWMVYARLSSSLLGRSLWIKPSSVGLRFPFLVSNSSNWLEVNPTSRVQDF
jgi:hypothetical protein